MKICMFTNTYLPHVGGVARSVAFFAKDLRALNHQVLVIAPSFSETPERETDVLRVPAIQNFNASDFSVRIPIPFLIDQEIDGFEPDLIHSHHPFLLGDAALRAARRRKLPLIFTYHTQYEKYTHYVPLDSESLKRFVINLATAYANLCSKVIAPSESIARVIRRREVKTPVTVIPTGVDVDFFAKGRGDSFRANQSIPRDAFVVGTCSRLAPEKNLVYLSRAVAAYLKTEPEARFLVVGEGPSSDDIRRILKERGVANQLVMVGNQSGSDLSDAYKAMDLFVFASKTETQGMVLLEAMAAGKAVIALDASGSREVVVDDGNGCLLASDASEETFSRKIAEFRKNEKRAGRWQKEARRTAQRLSRGNCALQLENLYQSVLESNRIHSGGVGDELISWNKLLKGIQTEWELMTQKTAAAVKSFQKD